MSTPPSTSQLAALGTGAPQLATTPSRVPASSAKSNEEELKRAIKGLDSLKIEDELWTSLDNSTKVFKGRDFYSLVYVQVKRVNKQFDDERVLKDLIHEVRILQKLAQHPHITEHLEWYQTKKHVWVVSEYLAGGNLRSVLVHHPLETFAVKDLARDVLRCLVHVHDMGIAHGDLRPDNIWLTENGVAKLSGFHVSRLCGDEEETQEEFASLDSLEISQERIQEHILQYAEYMAPELLRVLVKEDQAPWNFMNKPRRSAASSRKGGSHVMPLSKEADVWGLGVTLYEAYRGTPPFTGTSFMQLVERVVLDEPYYIEEKRKAEKNVSSPLSSPATADASDSLSQSTIEPPEFPTAPLLKLMFRKNPAKRFKCFELLNHLEEKQSLGAVVQD